MPLVEDPLLDLLGLDELRIQQDAQVFARGRLVTDDAIANAQKALWRLLRVAVEPGGAAAFAVLLSGRWRVPPGSTVGVLLCSANTGAVQFQ